MAAITWADVTGMAAELSAVNIIWQTVILGIANTQISVSAFDGEDGKRTRAVRTAFSAHFGALSLQGDGKWTGQVIAESALGLSRSYASNSPMGTDPLWDKTPYGQMLRALMQISYKVRGPMLC